MNSYAYLVALHKLTALHHSGQWSQGYRLLCIAQHYCNRWHCGANLGRTCEQLDKRASLYPIGGLFRSRVAYYLRELRQYKSVL